MDRRTLLSVLAATGVTVAAGGCVSGGTRQAASPSPSGPDPQLRDLADERDLLAVYDATIAAHPDLADRLGPMREDHAKHVEALSGLLDGSASPSAPSSAPAPEVPADTAGALAALRSAERDAAAARTDSCVAASGDRAALLGSVAASESSHAAVLT